MPLNILIADDNASVRRLLRRTIEDNSELSICGEAENGQVAVEQVKQSNPDVVILDYHADHEWTGSGPGDRAHCPQHYASAFYSSYPRRSIETSRGRRNPARLLKTRFLFASGRLAENNGGGQSILTYPIAHDMRNSVLFFSPLSLLSLHHFKALTRGLLQSRSVDDLDIPAG